MNCRRILKQGALLLMLFIAADRCTSPVAEYSKSFHIGEDSVVLFYKSKEDSLNYRKEFFYKGGKRAYVGHIVDGDKNGVWVWWYKNGNKKDQCKYADGFYVDTVYHWYESGRLKQIEIVARQNVADDDCSNCNGTIIRYFEDGSLDEQFTDIDCRFEGVGIIYQSNGGYISKTYRNDTLNGPTVEYFKKTDSNEETRIVGQYENGKENGLWKMYHNDSVLFQTWVYQKGMRIKTIIEKPGKK